MQVHITLVIVWCDLSVDRDEIFSKINQMNLSLADNRENLVVEMTAIPGIPSDIRAII